MHTFPLGNSTEVTVDPSPSLHATPRFCVIAPHVLTRFAALARLGRMDDPLA